MPGSVVLTGTATSATSETLPATSVTRTRTVVAASPTAIGPDAAVHAPSPSWYSTTATPEPASAPVGVTVRDAAFHPASAVGWVASRFTSTPTGSEVLPATSFARNDTVVVPSVATSTGAV